MSHKKHILYLAVLLVAPLASFASNGTTAEKADSLFARREYAKALPLYIQLQNEHESLTVNQLFRMAVSMTEGSTNQQQAINLLSRLTEFPIAPAETWYYLGEANRRMYKFEEAIDYFNIYLNRAKEDSELLTQAELQISCCENGLLMLDYATRVNRVAKKQISEEQFYSIYDTFYGMHISQKPQAMWMSADSLVENKHPLSNLVFIPEKNTKRDADVIYFSSYGQDKETGLDIFRIKRIEGDSWGEPEEIEAVNSPFDEILPYVTPDGKTLYFASNGHYGMGGFDIYKSEYDNAARSWSIPENLGFPISSPYDDFLFVPDAANRTACFASSRDTNDEELTIYKVEMSVTPERISVSDINETMAMASFNVDFSQPSIATAAESKSIELPIKELAGNESYVLLVKSATTLSKQLSDQQKSLNQLRQQLSSAGSDKRKELEQEVINGERDVEFTRATFSQVQTLLSDAEYQFYTEGKQPAISEDFKATLRKNLSEKTEAISTQSDNNFGQTVLSMQEAPELTMKPPKLSDADKYRFRTSGKSIILLNDPIPQNGIVYKIRIGVFSKSLTEVQLKNLSPVTTEKRGTTTRYYIGLFKTYNDALKALGEVKKKGFKDAVIDAWVNGKTEQTSRARAREKQNTQRTTTSTPRSKPGSKSTVYRVNVAVFGDVSKSNVPSLLASLSGGRDIARKVNPDGSTTYSVGIFTKQADADEIKQKLEAEGAANVEVVSIEINS